MTSWLALLCLLFSFSAQATGERVATEIDEQALPEFTVAEQDLFSRALGLVLESPDMPSLRPSILLTTRNSLRLREVLEATHTIIDEVEFSFTIQRSNPKKRGGPVVIFWDQIVDSADPLPLLISVLAREVLGSLAVVRREPRFSEGKVADNAFVYQTMIRFFRSLHTHPSYFWLSAEEKTALSEIQTDVTDRYRGLRATALAQGCSARLASQDN